MQYIITTKKSMINGEKIVLLNGKQEKIRYAPGEDSIFVKKQTDLAKKKHIPIANGMIVTTDTMQVEYIETLMKDPKHQWLKKYDPESSAKKFNEKIEVEAQAMANIVSGNPIDITVVAYMLGGRSIVYNADGTAKTIAQIKQSLYPIARVRSKEVLDAFEQSDDKKMEFFVSKAFIDDIVSYNPSTNKIIYSDSQQTLLNLKPNLGTDVEQLANYFKTQEGKKDFNDVKNYFASKTTDNNFSDIDGIGKATEKKIKEAGLRTYADIKKLTAEEFEDHMKAASVKFVGFSYEEIYQALTK